LNRDGITALAIHGNKSQGARTRALAEFKDASLQVLVATDIAARGIDIEELPHVVNYDMPNVPEDYVHRIGRTGRAGATGEAVSLVCVDEHAYLRDIEKLIKRTVPRVVIAGFEPDPNARAQPILQRQGGGQGRNASSSGGRNVASAGGGRNGGRGAGQGAQHAARGAKPVGGPGASRSAGAKAAPRAKGGGNPRGNASNGTPRAANGNGTAHGSNGRGHPEPASAPQAPQATAPSSGGLSNRAGLPPARTNAPPVPAKGRVIARFGGRGR
ncbi:MAG: helicase-related protein, partial [Casimicrobiaceae bacterium]